MSSGRRRLRPAIRGKEESEEIPPFAPESCRQQGSPLEQGKVKFVNVALGRGVRQLKGKEKTDRDV